MAKKDKKASKKKDGRDPTDVVEAVRGAVERTFQATAGQTEGARDRGRSLLDEVASAAQRIRESFDDLRVLEDIRGLRAEIQSLSERVAALERSAAKPAGAATDATGGKPTPPPKEPAAPKAAAAKKTPTRRTAARKPAAPKAPAKATAADTAAAKTAAEAEGAGSATKPTSTTTRRKTTSTGS
jgi:hypothetical protein